MAITKSWQENWRHKARLEAEKGLQSTVHQRLGSSCPSKQADMGELGLFLWLQHRVSLPQDVFVSNWSGSWLKLRIFTADPEAQNRLQRCHYQAPFEDAQDWVWLFVTLSMPSHVFTPEIPSVAANTFLKSTTSVQNTVISYYSAKHLAPKM